MRFNLEASLENAVDLLDTGLVLGSRELAQRAASWIHVHGDDATPAVRASAQRVLQRFHLGGTKAAPIFQYSESSPSTQIAELKTRLRENPRDAISACELSRLHTIMAQKNSAIKWMHRATILAPDDRYVLRCAAQLYSHLDAPKEALKILWKSDAVRHDPWVQAAEVALADSAGESPRWAHKYRTAIMEARPSIALSELAVGLGSLEEKTGAKRRHVRRLVEKGLARATENAWAQAVWLHNRTGFAFEHTAQVPIGFAGEAKALEALELRDYSLALQHGKEWRADELYSVSALAFMGGVADVFLGEHEQAAKFYTRAIELTPDRPMLHNGLLVAQALAGRLEEAEDEYRKLESHVSDPNFAPYVHAGRGLLAFKRGEVELGRDSYLAAMDACRKLESPSLSIVAGIYWVEQEAEHGFIAAEDWETFRKRMNTQVAKVVGPQRGHIVRLWAARESDISHIVRIRSEGARFSQAAFGRSADPYQLPPAFL